MVLHYLHVYLVDGAVPVEITTAIVARIAPVGVNMARQIRPVNRIYGTITIYVPDRILKTNLSPMLLQDRNVQGIDDAVRIEIGFAIVCRIPAFTVHTACHKE